MMTQFVSRKCDNLVSYSVLLPGGNDRNQWSMVEGPLLGFNSDFLHFARLKHLYNVIPCVWYIRIKDTTCQEKEKSPVGRIRPSSI